MTASTDPADPFEPLRRRFLARCREELALVERALAEPGFRSDPSVCAAVHRLSGAAGTFGYPAISVVAGRLDDRLQEEEIPTADDFEALAEALRIVLS